jgi:hypothetical protein
MKYILAILLMFLCGCSNSKTINAVLSPPSEGDIIPICTKWTNSISAWDRHWSTNMFARYEDKAWRIRCLVGTNYVKVFENDIAYENLARAEQSFDFSVAWQVQKGIHDAFSK